ncbi:uncharacterized protein [Dermacentor albipictus]|uniref:uncharacterized protein n=1 Tax=Dermacentor albipictus TaxID=60249 RepID=UPI0031FBB439
MEDNRSPNGVPPQKALPKYDLPESEHLGEKPVAEMGASPVPEPPPPARGGRGENTRTKSISGKPRRKTTKSAKSNREKLDQKEAGAAELPAGKHLEQPAESVYTKAPDIQRENLDHKETGATELPDGKRHEKAPEPVDTVAPERPGAKEAGREQLIPLVVPSVASKRKQQLLKKKRNSVSRLLPGRIFSEFVDKAQTTVGSNEKVKNESKKAADVPQQQKVLNNKALQDLLPRNQAPSSTLPANANACTRLQCIAGVLFFVVVAVMGVMVFLPSMRSPRTCDTMVCRYYARLLEDTLSNAVPPCIDFHAHVCAGWERSHGISVVDNVYERFIARVAEQVSTTTTPPVGQTAVQKAASLFQSCRSIYTGRRSELELVKKRLLDFGIFWPEMTNKSSVLRIIFSMGAAWNWGSFIHLSTWQPGRLRITPTLYFNRTLQRRQAMLSQMKRGNSYRKYFDKMVEAFGRAEGQVPSYKELTDLESVVLPVITEPYNAVPWRTLENVGLDELKALAIGSIPNDTWDEELRRHFNATPDGDYVFTISNVEFLKTFFGLVMSEGEPKMAYYLGWAIVQPASLLSNAELVNYFYQTEVDTITGHLRFCVYICHVYMGLPFYAGYMRTLVSPLIMQDVSALIIAVRKSLRARLEGATPAWSNLDAVIPVFDGHDQAEASAALSLFTDATEGHLNKLYERFPDMTPSTITNVELITIARRLTEANTEMARFHDTESSRFYYLKDHGMRLLPPAFELPVYHPQAPISIKYGTLGGQITEAVSRLLYKTAPSFDNLTASEPSCIANHADSARESDTLKITLSITSLSVLYDLFVEMSKNAARFPIGFYSVLTEGQLFFIMWCYMHCGSPNAKAKCNDPLKVLSRFHRAFGCKSGNPMYPRPECSL